MSFSAEQYPEVSIILPCKNEEAALKYCIDKIKKVLSENSIAGEIIVSDSSNDNSPNIAIDAGVVLVKHDKDGYGNAYLEGFSKVRGKYIFCADADGTYDFSEIPRFIDELRNGADFVIGNRFKGVIDNGAMPWMHKYIGNPFLSGTLRLFFGSSVKDAHCGMRVIKKEVIPRLSLKTTGMEFASEMVIKAIKKKLKIQELSINYRVRIGNSKLHTLSDGWRHMRFMLLYSPLFLFFIPGFILFMLGVVTMLWLYTDTPTIFGINLFFHPMFLSALLVITGYQLIIFSLFAKTYAFTHLGEDIDRMNKLYKYITIETASIVGILITILGAAMFLRIFFGWIDAGLGELNEIKNSIIALTFLVVGIQTIFSSFMLSILGIKER